MRNTIPPISVAFAALEMDDFVSDIVQLLRGLRTGGAPPGMLRRTSTLSLRPPLGSDLLANLFADQALGAFHKSEFVSEAGFEKHADGGMVQHIGSRDQSHVLADP